MQCTPSIKLESVLHVPAFPVSLVSLSALIDQIDCDVTLNKYRCLIQEMGTGRRLGAGTRHRGLWYMDRQEDVKTAGMALAAITTEKEALAMIHHCRFGHVSFEKMKKAFPDVMNGLDKTKLRCEACEYAKHTRISYVSKGLRSIVPFVIVHSAVWTCPSTSIN